ncbi:SusD/RagB family nutrient-binding outer membrane lipoprotein [Chitinophaga sp. Cy-1792]|uniref:SusD/RagB family nutrient-binding outer membrane lipoprotein n=1 Tax=Chitinophaga sp. Cy-1792 TaxID=2608339 RepID=UPI001423011E|nr:SusD/RagB family nutrient-binding outer membrane lipoprotein [Chitinophaga sp. Cy-1792]NIG56484.1 SusD/RagB family nutrient-binding outer membrane lipoprotein [Chitinophaga sp. Cy-1792]
MKNFRITTYAIFSATIMAGTSCTKDFAKLNTNPNTSDVAPPETLLAPNLYSMVNNNQTRALRLTNELMQDHVTMINSDEIHRYVVRPAESDNMWSNWYTNRTNFLDIYNGAKTINSKSYMAIGEILDVWTVSLITDVFGDVPYSEANKGRESQFQPKFDAQKDIYADLFTRLEEANTLLAAGQALPTDNASMDPLYAGDITKWRKFGNSLYLRLLMRVSAKAEMNAPAKIKQIVETPATYPIFTNNAESAILRFTTVPPYTSAFNTYRDYDFNGDNGLTTFFINNLIEWNDPRIAKWASTVNGAYEGAPSGYASGVIPERKSFYLASLKDEPLLGNIMNYSELQFILAEAALKGYINANPADYYNNGVEAGITLWGFALPAGYLTKDGIKWDTNLTLDNKLEMIMVQKYYCLFFTDFQQWIEYRRTGHPVLPKGPGLKNNGEMPSRFKYPVAVQSLNKTNYQAAVAAMGGDDINVKMWWNKN